MSEATTLGTPLTESTNFPSASLSATISKHGYSLQCHMRQYNPPGAFLEDFNWTCTPNTPVNEKSEWLTYSPSASSQDVGCPAAVVDSASSTYDIAASSKPILEDSWDDDDLSLSPWHQIVADEDGKPVPASYLKPISPDHKDHMPHELMPISEQSSMHSPKVKASPSSPLSVASVSNASSAQTSRPRKASESVSNGTAESAISAGQSSYQMRKSMNSRGLDSAGYAQLFPGVTLSNRPVLQSPARLPGSFCVLPERQAVKSRDQALGLNRVYTKFRRSEKQKSEYGQQKITLPYGVRLCSDDKNTQRSSQQYLLPFRRKGSDAGGTSNTSMSQVEETGRLYERIRKEEKRAKEERSCRRKDQLKRIAFCMCFS